MSDTEHYAAYRPPDRCRERSQWVVLGPWKIAPPGTYGAGEKYRPHVAECEREEDARRIAGLLNLSEETLAQFIQAARGVAHILITHLPERWNIHEGHAPEYVIEALGERKILSPPYRKKTEEEALAIAEKIRVALKNPEMPIVRKVLI